MHKLYSILCGREMFVGTSVILPERKMDGRLSNSRERKAWIRFFARQFGAIFMAKRRSSSRAIREKRQLDPRNKLGGFWAYGYRMTSGITIHRLGSRTVEITSPTNRGGTAIAPHRLRSNAWIALVKLRYFRLLCDNWRLPKKFAIVACSGVFSTEQMDSPSSSTGVRIGDALRPINWMGAPVGSGIAFLKALGRAGGVGSARK